MMTCMITNDCLISATIVAEIKQSLVITHITRIPCVNASVVDSVLNRVYWRREKNANNDVYDYQ